MRLIEECREEEDRMSIMNEMNNNEDSRVHTAGFTERSIVALAKVEEKEKIYKEAEETFKEIEIAKQKYYKALESLSEREGAIQDIEDRVNKLSKKS
jgi:TolB-like protein